jgi:hypothetical protein
MKLKLYLIGVIVVDAFYLVITQVTQRQITTLEEIRTLILWKTAAEAIAVVATIGLMFYLITRSLKREAEMAEAMTTHADIMRSLRTSADQLSILLDKTLTERRRSNDPHIPKDKR